MINKGGIYLLDTEHKSFYGKGIYRSEQELRERAQALLGEHRMEIYDGFAAIASKNKPLMILAVDFGVNGNNDK